MDTGYETPREQRLTEPAICPTVFAPLDGSDRALAALPIAKALADLRQATLHVVHACDTPRPPLEMLRHLGLHRSELGHAVVDEVSGSPARAIVERACECPDSIIVISAHTDVMAPGQELGPVTEEVLRTSSCPVVLVRPERGEAPWTLRRILLAHDGSPFTAAAFGPAVSLAEQAQAELFVLHVATLTGDVVPGTLPVPPYVDQPQHEWPEWSREFLERMEVFCDLPAHMQPRLFLSRGDPGEEILRFTAGRDIDLIALAWHGSLEGARAETVKQVLLTAPCPVLFLRAEEQRADRQPVPAHQHQPSATAAPVP